MKVAFHVRRRPGQHPAIAALVPGRDTEKLLSLCAELGLDPMGRVHDVSGGFLVRFDDPTDRPLPGVVRLRALAANLFLPADGVLIPALLDDEASALVRDHGLVFMPDGCVLGLDPRAPLDLGTLLVAPRRLRLEWQPLPRRLPLAERIEEIIVDLPPDAPDAVLSEGDAGSIGTESPRPDEAGPAATALGNAALGAGRGLAWLGKAVGSGWLASIGADWMEKALRMAPRLSEDLLGRQAAALRNLLREFREGDIERALRRALPLGDPAESRGAIPYGSDRLPTTNLAYGLSDLLSGPSRSGPPVGAWLGGQDVMAELTREYRKAAEDALRRGDYRRAAAIYGKLLRDYRSAAHALVRGALYRDAALILLAKLDDRGAAARYFELAGEFDRAIQLYRQLKDHESAGDLFRKIGEVEAALAEYLLAADHLSIDAAGLHSAGNLLLSKAQRPDLALVRYAASWARRSSATAIASAQKIAQIVADHGDVSALTALVDEVDAYFETCDDLTAADQFYNGISDLAGRRELESARVTLRDRALMGLAAQVRKQARPGVNAASMVPTLFGRHADWPAALVSDASFAVAATTKAPPEASPATHLDPSIRRFRVANGVVSAVTSAPATGAVFIGFQGGDVFLFRPETSEVIRIADYELPVAALGTDPEGDFLVILRAHPHGGGIVSAYALQPDGSYRILVGTSIEDLSEPWLTPICTDTAEPLFGLWDGEELRYFDVATMNSRGSLIQRPRRFRATPRAGLLIGSNRDASIGCIALLHDGDEWCLFAPDGELVQRTGLRWEPGLPAQSPLRSYHLSGNVNFGSEHLDIELAGLDASGTLHWGLLNDGHLVASNRLSSDDGYVAAALASGSLVAAVTTSSVEWLRRGPRAFTPCRSKKGVIPRAIACASSLRTGALIVVCADGFVARVPFPA
jgi:tetratricopeptide (TPR) repeat protein